MKNALKWGVLCALLSCGNAMAQTPQIEPRVLTKTDLDGKVTAVQVAPRFVTTIRVPDPVNSVVVGDPTEFQVEHSDREPKLVFVKALSMRPSETNLLISTSTGREVNLLLINHGAATTSEAVDLLVKYDPSSDFFIGSSGFPFALVGATVPLISDSDGVHMTKDPVQASPTRNSSSVVSNDTSPVGTKTDPSANLDQLLAEQEDAPLPILYGEHIQSEFVKGDRVRAGVSRVIDGGQQVVVLFSVLNPTKRPILLMPPQVQLGGTKNNAKHSQKWTTAEQLPIEDFRVSRRRLGPGERADGVVVFERPPYKQSNETLLLQVADSGAVDRPALAPIGFGVSTAQEEGHGRGK